MDVLLVEDSDPDAELVVEHLADAHQGARVEHVGTLSAALMHLAASSVDVALVDLSLPDAEGLDAVRALRAAAPTLPLVVLTGLDRDTTALQALAAGAQDYLPKDELTPRLLLRTLRYARERAAAQESARQAAVWTAALLDGLESPTCAVDRDGQVVALNAALRRHGAGLLLARSPGDDLTALWESASAPLPATPLLAGLREVLAGRLPRFELECCVEDDRWYSVRMTPLAAGLGAVVTQVDVTTLKRAQQQLSTAALHDTLTGLPNRALLADRLEQARAHAVREDGVLAVAFLDLDRFKSVNDALGHTAGDALLRVAADRLLAVSRDGDTVARVSGDEFVVAWVAEDAAQAQPTAERFVAALNETVVLDGRELPLSASAGLAVSTTDDTADDVLRLADEAMYSAKAHGGRRLEVASDDLRELLARRATVEATLARALAEDRLEVHYQPVVGTADGAPVGVEALMRLRAEDGGLLAPIEFIEVAERTGLIVELGRRVLASACREAASWTGDAALLTVAVNLSTRQLSQPDVVATVRACLQLSGLDPDRLVLEVTESAVVDDTEAALRALTSLRALGVRIAIDDFGTGYSSFLYLRQFPVDVLKIDRTFVAGMLTSPDDAAIVASITRLGRDVGLLVIAEGVETEQQRAHLARLGCEQAQGYYFSRPVPAVALPAALAAAPRTAPCRDDPVLRAVPTRAVPTQTEPATRERVQRLAQDGASLHTIAALLNRQDVPSPSGRRWHPRAVARLLDPQLTGTA